MNKYDTLNDRQREAVFYTEGPLLILAGAGSGKTRVLTHRIAYLIEEKGVAPYNIMAITFTNKAAAEMKSRVEKLVDFGDSVWVATFHSSCVRILRRFIDRLGYGTEFTIYDTDDQKAVVRKAVRELDLDTKIYKERPLVAYISQCKNDLYTPEEKMKEADSLVERKKAEIYAWYEGRLRANNALDFDDLLLKTVQLFKENPDVLEYYQKKFKYIMVDEYQDTNHVQFELIRLLSLAHRNLAVVGDDDQSIYAFRGADIRNILEFESCFPGTKVVKLEQNYRSTTGILDVANAVIHCNMHRKDKHLWSDLGRGQQVFLKTYDTAQDEARETIRTIRDKVRRGDAEYKDFAILYRTNAQSRLFEDQCVRESVPYVIVGGVNFYQREEIKDVLSYLKVVAGSPDNVACERIINKPKRGIGDTTVARILAYGGERGESLLTTLSHVNDVPGLSAAAIGKAAAFYRLIEEIRRDCLLDGIPEERKGFGEIIRVILDKVGYDSYLAEYEDERREQKTENLQELVSKAVSFEEKWPEEGIPTLTDFLEDVALVADVDSLEDDDNKVVIMTLHGSKGLEFPEVFLAGLEEGLFPSSMSIFSDEGPKAVEEERRLCYVGITRAMRCLTLTRAKSRMINGETQNFAPSRFLKEIPKELITEEDHGLGLRDGERGTGIVRTGRSFGTGFGTPGFGRDLRDLERGSFGKSFPGTERKTIKEMEPGFGKPKEKETPMLKSLDYQAGDRVRHDRFGEGKVVAVEDGKKDFLVTVEFDSLGVRKMMASFAKLEKI